MELRDIVNILYGARSLMKLLRFAYESFMSMNSNRRIGTRSTNYRSFR